jgi:hypothetical protein
MAIIHDFLRFVKTNVLFGRQQRVTASGRICAVAVWDCSRLVTPEAPLFRSLFERGGSETSARTELTSGALCVIFADALLAGAKITLLGRVVVSGPLQQEGGCDEC